MPTMPSDVVRSHALPDSCGGEQWIVLLINDGRRQNEPPGLAGPKDVHSLQRSLGLPVIPGYLLPIAVALQLVRGYVQDAIMREVGDDGYVTVVLGTDRPAIRFMPAHVRRKWLTR